MSRKSRILYIGTFPPPIHGSAVVSLQIKNSKIINSSFNIDYVNIGTCRKMEEAGKLSILKFFRFLYSYFNVSFTLLIHNYDVCWLAITCHGIGFLKDAPFVLLCKLFRKKIVIHQHNKGMANDVDRWPYRWLFPLCYKNAKVILLSWYLYPDIEKVVKKDDVFICPNGIKVQDSPTTLKVVPKANKVPRLLFLSNLIESKGVLVLLDALKILKDKGCSFICDFVGGETKEIDAKRFREEVEKRGLNEIAIYQGRKYGEEKEEILEKCDVFTLPTSNDCFPLVLLEAMSHHLPIVSTPIGGIPDIISDGENGIISEDKNPSALAVALERLVKDENLRSKMGAESFRLLNENFTEDAFQIRMKEILETNLGGGNLDYGIQWCCVRCLGKKFGEEKEKIFSESDIFVFPTYYDNECFPLVLLEAMQHGLPCVTTDEGGIRDIVRDGGTGYICPKQDSFSIADALYILLENSALRLKMAKSGLELFRDSFSEEKFELNICDIFNKIIFDGGNN